MSKRHRLKLQLVPCKHDPSQTEVILASHCALCSYELKEANKHFPWSGCIVNAGELDDERLYDLHAAYVCGSTSYLIGVVSGTTPTVKEKLRILDKYNLRATLI